MSGLIDAVVDPTWTLRAILYSDARIDIVVSIVVSAHAVTRGTCTLLRNRGSSATTRRGQSQVNTAQ